MQRMLQNGGKKPTTTEYTLQQVIFVIPDSERGKLIGAAQARGQWHAQPLPVLRLELRSRQVAA